MKLVQMIRLFLVFAIVLLSVRFIEPFIEFSGRKVPAFQDIYKGYCGAL